MLGLLLGALDPISRITGQIANARIASANAQTDREKIGAEERVKSLELRRDVLVAEAGDKSNRLMRIALAFGPCFILNKIYVWDKALGEWTGGRTDALDENLWWVITAVVGFYFLADTASRVARILKSR